MNDNHFLVEAMQFILGGAAALVAWIFTRNLGRIDAIERRVETLVTKAEVQERCDTLANLIKESQRADKAEIHSILHEEMHKLLTPYLKKEPFRNLSAGYVGKIIDRDEE